MSRKRIDITNQTFGKLTVIKEIEQIGKYRMWLCKCTCGNETIVKQESLRSGNTESCGCMQSVGPSRANRADHTSKRFGNLVAIKRIGNKKFSDASTPLWLCKCDCGNETIVTSSNLMSGHTRSCGCLGSVSGDRRLVSPSKEAIIKEITRAYKEGEKRPTLKDLGSTFNYSRQTISNNLEGEKVAKIWKQLKLEEKKND